MIIKFKDYLTKLVDYSMYFLINMHCIEKI